MEALQAPGAQILPPQPASSHQPDATEHGVGKDSPQRCLHTRPQTSETAKMRKHQP